jgi:hypothetical protein
LALLKNVLENKLQTTKTSRGTSSEAIVWSVKWLFAKQKEKRGRWKKISYVTTKSPDN